MNNLRFIITYTLKWCNMSFKRKVLFVYIILSLCLSTNAQNRIRFNHITINDGLSQSSVTCIFQDQKGFMWFGTQDGLNRFDGYNFKIFKNIPNDENSLTENFIFSIYEDISGVLYIETQSGNFHRYNPKTESFTVIPKDSIDFTKAKFNSIKAMFTDATGKEWTGGLGNPVGLKMQNFNTNQKMQFNHNPADPNSLSDDKVYSVFENSRGNLFVGTFNGLDLLINGKKEFIHYRHNPNDPNSLSDNWVWPIFEDANGIMWIGTVRSGLNRFDPTNKSFISYQNIPADPTSLSDNYIFSIYQDRGGVIWIGTNAGGINYFHPSSQVFDHFVSSAENKNSLKNNSILSIHVDNKGNYWIGTENGGLDKFDYQRNLFQNLLHNAANSNSISSNSIQTIYQDKSGILWFGSFSSGLDEFNPKTGIFKHYINIPSNPNSLSDNRVYSITEDIKGNIWIGTYGGGLNKLNRKTGKISRFQTDPNDSSSISSNATWTVIEDGEGNIWAGTFGGGINVFDPNKNSFKRIQNVPNDSTSLMDNNIIRLFKDRKNNIWIGTTKGLSLYLPKTNSFKNYREKDGLANDFVYGILEDDKGLLWLSTNNGLSCFNPDKEIFKNYYFEDGLQGNEFNQNAFAKDRKTGRLLFGGPNGLNVFHPDSLKMNAYLPPVVLSNYIKYSSDDEEGKPIYEKGISERDSIFLTYKENIINFEFAALSFRNNSMNQYRYKLEGFNDNWIQLGTDNTVTFTNLTAGDYNLHIIGSNNDGIWNEEGTKLFINVTPPWWKTNIAYAVYAISLLGILFGVRQYEINRREQKAQIRETELLIIAGESEKRALRVENERKTKELEDAREMQLSMLPKEIPVLDHLEIAAYMRTATEVGGDYYDFIIDENGTLNIAFGDATGHGLKAGTMVTLMKGFFTLFGSNSEIKTFFEKSTKTLKEIKLGRVMMAFSFLKIKEKLMCYSSVGMPPMYYFSKLTGTVEELVVKGMPLGAMATIPFYSEIEKKLVSGDVFMLFSDGIPEQMNSQKEMYDYPRFKGLFETLIDKSPQELIDTIIKTIDDWRGKNTQDDDITLMVVRVK